MYETNILFCSEQIFLFLSYLCYMKTSNWKCERKCETGNVIALQHLPSIRYIATIFHWKLISSEARSLFGIIRKTIINCMHVSQLFNIKENLISLSLLCLFFCFARTYIICLFNIKHASFITYLTAATGAPEIKIKSVFTKNEMQYNYCLNYKKNLFRYFVYNGEID